MDRLRAPSISLHVVEALHAGRSGPCDAPQMMKLRYAGELLLNRVPRGQIGSAGMGERHCDVNVVRDERLRLYAFARSIFRTRANFRASFARVVSRENELPRDAANFSGA